MFHKSLNVAVKKTPPPHRRTRDRPPPSLVHAQSNHRGGNPLGCACGIRGPPRYDKKRHPLTGERGTGPRATGKLRPEGSPTVLHRNMKHPQFIGFKTRNATSQSTGSCLEVGVTSLYHESCRLHRGRDSQDSPRKRGKSRRFP